MEKPYKIIIIHTGMTAAIIANTVTEVLLFFIPLVINFIPENITTKNTLNGNDSVCSQTISYYIFNKKVRPNAIQ